MSRKLIIDGNAVYEIDEKCMLKKKLGELKEKKITSDEKRAEQSAISRKNWTNVWMSYGIREVSIRRSLTS